MLLVLVLTELLSLHNLRKLLGWVLILLPARLSQPAWLVEEALQLASALLILSS